MEKSVAEIKKESAPAREIGIITAEIKDLCRQAQTMALLYAVEIGRRLVEAKRALPYGKWGEWLKNEVEFSQSSANNFMKLYEEYGAAQISIFGASVDSQTFANLPYSKALQLLAVPRDEREAFAEEVGAADLSTRELKAAIEAREKAEKEAREAKAREEDLADKLAEAEAAAEESAAKAAEADAIAAKLAAKQAQERLEEAQKKLKTASPEVTAFKALFDSMQGTAAKLRTMIEKIRSEDPETADKLAAALKAFGSSL